jgi:acetyl-CoA carboxylase beta subunit
MSKSKSKAATASIVSTKEAVEETPIDTSTDINLQETVHFCPFCENNLYTRMMENNIFEWHCRNCNHTENIDKEDDIVVFLDENYNNDEVLYSLFKNPHLKHDNALPSKHNIICKNKQCTKKEDERNNIIYIKYDVPNMKFMYMCKYCDFRWKTG